VVIPPPIKPKSYVGRHAETPPSRGPLSYDALVHLRRSASAKKSPLCPTLDHTIEEQPRHPPVSTAATHQNHRKLVARAPSSASAHNETFSRPHTSQPVVAQKPSSTPQNASRTPSHAAASPTSPPPDSSASKRFADPQKIRKEALQKLGLLKDDREPKSGSVTSLSHSQSQTTLDLVSKRMLRAPAAASSNPSRSPSFSHRQVPKDSQARPVQSSASFHHHYSPRRGHNFLSDPCDSVSIQRPEHPRNGAEHHGPSLSRSVSMGVQSSSGDGRGPHYHHKALHGKASEPVRRTATQPAAQERSTAGGGFSMPVLPDMGADRKEALRKLGLLKD